MLPVLPRPAAAFGRPGADKVAFHVGQAAEHGEHQAPGAGAGVGPRLGERAELRLSIHDALDDAEQVEGAPRQAVDPCHRHHIAGAEPVARRRGSARRSRCGRSDKSKTNAGSRGVALPAVAGSLLSSAVVGATGIGVTGRFVRNRTVSRPRGERGANTTYRQT